MYCIYILYEGCVFSYRTLGLHAVVCLLFLFTFISNIKPPHMDAEAF